MAKRLMDRVLVVDVEATCWDGPVPEGQESEIIEVGVCVLDVASLQPVDRRSILVRPEHSAVSAFCTELTTLTEQEVMAGVPVAQACATLREEFGSAHRVWASYGDYDRAQFQRECAGKGVPYPFGSRHLNVKTLFGLARALPREVGMAQALDLAGLPLAGTHHRGGDDAWNIAALLAGLLGSSRGGGRQG